MNSQCHRLSVLGAAQHSVHPTSGTRRVFKPFSWLEVGSAKIALSSPAQPRVTPAVSHLLNI